MTHLKCVKWVTFLVQCATGETEWKHTFSCHMTRLKFCVQIMCILKSPNLCAIPFSSLTNPSHSYLWLTSNNSKDFSVPYTPHFTLFLYLFCQFLVCPRLLYVTQLHAVCGPLAVFNEFRWAWGKCLAWERILSFSNMF